VTQSPQRIAMWSGPRNLSTALMYAFGNRSDCACWDEPFYAFYLTQSGIDHPLRDESIAAGEADFDRVVARCLGPVPDGKPVFYQKHMTHHMLPGFDRSWAFGLTNAFLIRAPERVLASYARNARTSRCATSASSSSARSSTWWPITSARRRRCSTPTISWPTRAAP
jgi:hypothetical protein